MRGTGMSARQRRKRSRSPPQSKATRGVIALPCHSTYITIIWLGCPTSYRKHPKRELGEGKTAPNNCQGTGPPFVPRVAGALRHANKRTVGYRRYFRQDMSNGGLRNFKVGRQSICPTTPFTGSVGLRVTHSMVTVLNDKKRWLPYVQRAPGAIQRSRLQIWRYARQVMGV